MFIGIRTPVKDLTTKTDSPPRDDSRKALTEGAGPLTDPETQTTSKVRRSIGEIESRQKSPRSKKPDHLSQQEEKAKAKSTTGGPKMISSQKAKIITATADKSPKIQVHYKSRTSEAKACLLKAKMKMDQSRNLKTDIKADVLEAVERLYALVKEAEEARLTDGKPPQTNHPPPPRRTPSTKTPFQLRLKNRLHS